MSLIDTITIGLRTTEESCPSDSSTAVITLSNFSHHLTHTAITLISLNNRSSKLIRAWKEGGCRRGVIAQWQSTGGSSQRPWVRFPAAPLLLLAPLFLSGPCRFKGLRTVAAPIVSLIDTITIGLRTTEESCPSDSTTAVITLSNFSHHLTHTAITLISLHYFTLIYSSPTHTHTHTPDSRLCRVCSCPVSTSEHQVVLPHRPVARLLSSHQK